jgi:hypothetical protein
MAINPGVLIFLTADQISSFIAGPKTFDLELFKENTNYDVIN